MSDLDDFKATYFDECSELLAELEEQFAAIEAGDRSSERLHAVFRAIHSIKGGGGAFGFTALVDFTHAYETLLDHIRDGRLELTESVTALCIRANDVVADFVHAARAGEALAPDYGAEERARFDALLAGGPPGGPADDEPIDEFDIDFVPVMVRLDDDASASDAFAESPMHGAGEGRWEIRFTPHSELYARANDPLLLFRELASLGPIEVRAILHEIPALADFEPFGVYCSWEITLEAPQATEQAIAEVFEFVEGNCDLSIARVGAAEPGNAPGPAAPVPSFAELLAAEAGASAPSAVRAAPVPPPPSESMPPVVPGPLSGPASADSSGALDADRRVGPEDRRNGVQSIRVDLEKVDRVVNMVGELVITQSMLTQQMDETLRARYQELVRGLEVLAQTTRGLQDAVMSIRAQPVKTVFSRMPRLVRELAARTGKKIRLDTIGETTEIDKTVIEQLSDPLTHMIRNSADHGIEMPDLRRAAGKPETGTIRLSAEQAGGNILIVVEDDGAGINRERVLQVARDRMIVGPDQQLSDEQIDQLIFAPGFSTVATVTDISGRGVGMDVVLSNIKRIGGSVNVKSWPGRGTRMTLRLPLTLAVLDVMLVEVAGSPYVIPLSSIVETIQCARASFSRLPTGSQILQVRGEYVQVIDLAQRFGLSTGVADAARFVVLCEAEGGVKRALIVDDIIGQQQVVIKSLEENFESIEGIAGGTILGDGSVALIIDVQGLKANVPHRSAA
ncbi:MAG TPA: chemotaxis protein CheA [Alphaproteobacteria bacterium]|nr:chemotaxis protein CheA [Alphaproteobacteria bacterium]